MSESIVAPEYVISPRRDWAFELPERRRGGVVFNADKDGGKENFALACGYWRTLNGIWQPRLAIRWNGEDWRPKGNPQSRGYPTWFILPDFLAPAIADKIAGRIRAAKNKALLAAWIADIGPA